MIYNQGYETNYYEHVCQKYKAKLCSTGLNKTHISTMAIPKSTFRVILTTLSLIWTLLVEDRQACILPDVRVFQKCVCSKPRPDHK